MPMCKLGISQHKECNSVNVEEAMYTFQPFKLKSNTQTHLGQGTRRISMNKMITPKPRSGHRVVCDDVNMYSFGGYNPALTPSEEADLAYDTVWSDSKPLFKELWRYNTSTSVWAKLDVQDIPDILASNAIHLSGNLLMVYGGTGVPFGANCSNDLYVCDLKNKPDELKFSLVSATGNCPQAQYGQAIVLINHYLYTIGGTTGFEYTCDIHRLNLKDEVWESVYTCIGTDNEPPGRYRHEVAFFDSKIVVLGGGTSLVAFDFQLLYAFNLKTNMWEKMTARPDDKTREAYPVPRRCHSCVQHDQNAYIIGGFSGRLILKDIWRLDLNTLQWKKLSNFSLNRGVYFHSSCLTTSGKMFTFGGIVQADNNSKRSSEVHSAWLCIPKLKEICWEAINFYDPNLTSVSEKDLLLIGLPYEYINRLGISSSKNKSNQSSIIKPNTE